MGGQWHTIDAHSGLPSITMLLTSDTGAWRCWMLAGIQIPECQGKIKRVLDFLNGILSNKTPLMSYFFLPLEYIPKKSISFLRGVGRIYPLCFVVKGRRVSSGDQERLQKLLHQGETGVTVMVFVIFLLWNFLPLKINRWNLKIAQVEKENHLNHPPPCLTSTCLIFQRV